MAFRIGKQQITREDMPSMTAFMQNPDHLRQSIQDVLNMKLGNVQLQNQQPVVQGQMEQRSQTWQ